MIKDYNISSASGKHRLDQLRNLVSAKITKCRDCQRTQVWCTYCVHRDCVLPDFSKEYYCRQCIERHHVFHELAGRGSGSSELDLAWAKAEYDDEATTL